MSDSWRLTTTTNSGTDADVTSNWERVDETAYGSIGTGLTESSGIFSFPQTGIYCITYHALFSAAASDTTVILQLKATTDNATYDTFSRAFGGNPASGTSVSTSGSQTVMIDVTDISNVKFKFTTSSFAGNTRLEGSTSSNYTSFTFIKLGANQ